ncbi:MAG: tRNA-guanine transglycosylase, partial [Desulfobacteraceae bacterium]|nr:tRNA-guanine transglycosylase [Desulfobacteraceae bacterium]
MSLLRARNGTLYELPIFLPVYHPIASPVPMELWVSEFDVEACIVNAFFLYKDRATRTAFKAGKKIQEHISFPGLVMTDSGAFQGFQGELYLKNKTIVLFQEMIGADIVSPLDLVTPPGDKRTVAEKKWKRTLIRTKEAKELLSEATLAGVQQGGRYYDIRRQCTGELLELDISYLALGSLVPFFNKNHDMGFVGTVIKDARDMCGKNMPIHVYGA